MHRKQSSASISLTASLLLNISILKSQFRIRSCDPCIRSFINLLFQFCFGQKPCRSTLVLSLNNLYQLKKQDSSQEVFKKLVRAKAKRLFEKHLSKNINYIPRKPTTAIVTSKIRIRYQLITSSFHNYQVEELLESEEVHVLPCYRNTICGLKIKVEPWSHLTRTSLKQGCHLLSFLMRHVFK